MAEPRRVSTRRAVLSYSQIKDFTEWPDLLVKDYQGILQDFAFTSDEIDDLEARVIQNEADIVVIKADIVDLQLRVADLEYRVFNIVNTTTSLVSGPFDTILCKNTTSINITLDTDAKENDEVNIKRKGGEVVVIGLIDGFTNKTINILNYSMKLVFDGTEWSEI